MAGHSLTLNDSAYFEGMDFDDDTVINDDGVDDQDHKADAIAEKEEAAAEAMERLDLVPDGRAASVSATCKMVR